MSGTSFAFAVSEVKEGTVSLVLGFWLQLQPAQPVSLLATAVQVRKSGFPLEQLLLK